ncbi:MAG TPA: protein-disulfide reductase DsbD domain-containing protein [Verrucomicrobiae bacterium]|nr:protein-disulfide reductase DsbD domain-containing protein [Verrucomicrobiae bacterium]
MPQSAIYMYVRIAFNILLAAALFLDFRVHAAHAKTELVFADAMAKPGETVLAGVHFQFDPGWHTYWRNPGGPGFPASIEWELPAGVTNDDLQWPVPEKLEDSLGTWYIYQKDLVLLAPLKIAPSVKPGVLHIKATINWLECSIECVPEKAGLSGDLQIGAETKPSDHANLIDSWRKKLPRPAGELPAAATWEGPATGKTRSLLLEWKSAQTPDNADFYPYSSDTFEVVTNITRIASGNGSIRLRVPIGISGDAWPTNISGVIVQQTGANEQGYEIALPISAQAEPSAKAAAYNAPHRPLWEVLVSAFLGGLILNVMPCVLPVIALKILGFVGEAQSERRRVRWLGILYAAGVLASFLAMALFVIGVQAAGRKAGWGMQFSSPQFLVVLTVLVTLVALNLFGVFEITPGGKVMDAAGAVASRHGASGAFFNGVLATVLATPCTAPFLSFALGAAFTQTAPIIVLVFVMIGCGLASPYVLLSWNPGWLKFLPKPGAWMQRFKIAMGFPMLATAFWLLSLLPLHYGEHAWLVGLFLVIAAFAAWLFGEFYQRARSRRGMGLTVAIAFVALGYLGVMEHALHWRNPPEINQAAAAENSTHPAGLKWQEWSPTAIEAARARGNPVLVDFTAQWCLTCNTLVKPALENPEVRKKISELKAVPLVADYTRFAPGITSELNRFGRAGVPLVVVYPSDKSQPPMVLPDPLPFGDYSRVILDALGKLGK